MTRKALLVLVSVSLNLSVITDTNSLGWLAQQGFVTTRDSQYMVTIKGTKYLDACLITKVKDEE